MAQNGLARELPQQTPGATTPVHKTKNRCDPESVHQDAASCFFII